ncbi:MAG: response regulator [Eubacteriales bacterium]
MFKVFLVEDEIVVREGIRKNIQWEQYGFSFAGDAPDGELALPLIRDIQPDLLITDIKMPFMDGLALSELVRKNCRAPRSSSSADMTTLRMRSRRFAWA